MIDVWHDRRIGPGLDMHQEIDRHLTEADLILLLISPDFINSDFCYCHELRSALQRHAKGHARVIPVILRPVDWKTTPIGKLLAIPRDGKPVINWHRRDDALLDIATRVREIAEEIIAIRGTTALISAELQHATSNASTGMSGARALRQRTNLRGSNHG
jgi:hypothetical protein